MKRDSEGNIVERKTNIFSLLSILFISAFICGIGSFNQFESLLRYRLSMIEVILSFGCLLISIFYAENGKLAKTGLVRWLLPLLVIVVSGFIGVFPQTYLLYFVFFSIFILWGDGKRYEVVLIAKIVRVFGIIVAASVFIDYFNQQLMKTFYNLYSPSITDVLVTLRRNNYTSGITIQPAYAAIYLVVSIGITIYLIDANKWMKRLQVTGMYIALLFTGKRMSSVAVLVAITIVYLAEKETKGNRFVKFLKVGLGIYALYILLDVYSNSMGNSSAVSRVFLLFERMTSGENVFSQRSDLWALSLEEFYNNPILGAGWGRIVQLTESWSNTSSGLATHNIYIQLLAETGLVGTALFLSPFVIEYVKSFKKLISKVSKSKLIKFGVFWETFFFLYGFTGNPIYDLCPLCLFFVSVLMCRVDEYGNDFVSEDELEQNK